MEQQPSTIQIQKQIQLIQYLFQNKQLDQFVQRVQKFILPHYEKCHHSGKYKQKTTQSLKNQQKHQEKEEKIKQNIVEAPKPQQQNIQQLQKQKQQQQKPKIQQQKINQIQQKQQEHQLLDPSELNKLKQIQGQLQQLKIDQENFGENQQQIYSKTQKQQQQIISQNVAEEINQNKRQQTKEQTQLQQHKTEYKQQPINPIDSQQSQQLNIAKQQISAKQQSSTLKQQPKKQHQQQQKSVLTQSLSQQIKNAVKRSKIHILEKYDEMKLVLFKIEREMKKLQIPMTQNKQWKVNKINATSSIGVKTKGTLVQIRYEGIVQTNIFNLCVMIYLSQLYKQWVPFCSGSKTITEPSPLQKIVLMDLKIPFLTQRYAYLHGIAIDRITKNGKLYIYAQGITHEKQLLIHVHKADKAQYDKKVAKSVVLDAKYMVCEIGNEGNGKYQVKVYGMLDSHMPMLPQKIVNYIVKQLGGMIFDKIVKRAKDIKNTPWEKQLKLNEKRQQKNRFYDWLNQRVTNWDKSQALRKSKI